MEECESSTSKLIALMLGVNQTDSYRLFNNIRKKRVLAAVNIQRHWRGYCVRKQKELCINAAVKIQTAYRGWIVRWNMNKHLAEYIKARNDRYFNEMARKIGVLWRGYWVRKNLPDSQNMVKRRQLREIMAKACKDILILMEEDLNRLRNGPKSKAQIAEEEDQCKQWVPYILHKCHHLLRTKHIPGIYSDNQKDEFTYVEQLMKSLQMRGYMDIVRKEYYDMLKQVPPKPPYVYDERAIRHMEDTFKLRYKLDDCKSTCVLDVIDENIKEIPFILNTRIPEKPYEKLLAFEDGPYTLTKPLVMQRDSEPELNISKHDFKLSKKVVKKDPNVPPYHIDNGNKPKCDLHYPINLYGDYQ